MSTAPHHTVDVEVLGPWSLATSKTFWEGFPPAALKSEDEQGEPQRLRSVFRVDGDWSRAEVEVTQEDSTARVVVTGNGDLEAGRGAGLPVSLAGHRRPRVAGHRPARPGHR